MSLDLTSVDLSALSQITKLGRFFLCKCTGLRSVVVAKESSQVLQNAASIVVAGMGATKITRGLTGRRCDLM